MEQNRIIAYAGISGAVSVALGAMGAHALKDVLNTESLVTFETAVRYQMYHSLALLCIGILPERFRTGMARWSAPALIAGIFLFCFSLYFLALRPLFGIDTAQFKWIGAITPFGGISFILAWLMLALNTVRNKS